MSGYIDTYYLRSLAPEPPPRPALSGPLEADVCVVGGGLAGLTCALELARAGKRVAVLDSRRIGFGASGRNGGFVSPGYSTGYDANRRVVGEARAQDLHRWSIEGMQIVAQNIARLGIAEASPTPGILRVNRYPDRDGLEAVRGRLARDYGYEVEVLPTQAVRDMLASPRYFEGLLDRNAFHFHPLAYAHGLAREIERLGGVIHEGTPAIGLEEGAVKTVRTPAGRVSAAHVVVACGGYTDGLVPELRRSHIPIATYVMLSEAAPELIASAIRAPYGVGDGRRAGDYYRLVDGGRRLLWGGRITTRTTDPRALAELMKKTVTATFPQLAGLKVETAWSGLMSYARHKMPELGALRPGLWYAMGFGGHGMNTTAIGGRVVAEAILGDRARLDAFAPFGLAWNGGPFGTVAVQLTYWGLQALDLWNERRAA